MASLGSKPDYFLLALAHVLQIEFSLLIFASIAQLEMGLMDADLICFKNLIQFCETLLNKANKFLFFSRPVSEHRCKRDYILIRRTGLIWKLEAEFTEHYNSLVHNTNQIIHSARGRSNKAIFWN